MGHFLHNNLNNFYYGQEEQQELNPEAREDLPLHKILAIVIVDH